jgi:hypothetical protein
MVPIRGREYITTMPHDRTGFRHFIFAESDLKGILGEEIENAYHKQAYLFSV